MDNLLNINIDQNLLRFVVNFSIGFVTGGGVVHLFHIINIKQVSKGNKSPNTSGKENKVNIS